MFGFLFWTILITVIVSLFILLCFIFKMQEQKEIREIEEENKRKRKEMLNQTLKKAQRRKERLINEIKDFTSYKYNKEQVDSIKFNLNNMKFAAKDRIDYYTFLFVKEKVAIAINNIDNNNIVEEDFFDDVIHFCYKKDYIYNYIRKKISQQKIAAKHIDIPGSTFLNFSQQGMGVGFSNNKRIEIPEQVCKNEYYYKSEETLSELKERIHKYYEAIADYCINELIKNKISKNIMYGIFEKYKTIPYFATYILKSCLQVSTTYGEFLNIKKEIIS